MYILFDNTGLTTAFTIFEFKLLLLYCTFCKLNETYRYLPVFICKLDQYRLSPVYRLRHPFSPLLSTEESNLCLSNASTKTFRNPAWKLICGWYWQSRNDVTAEDDEAW